MEPFGTFRLLVEPHGLFYTKWQFSYIRAYSLTHEKKTPIDTGVWV